MRKLTEQLIVRGGLATLVTMAVFIAYGLEVEPAPRTVVDLGTSAQQPAPRPMNDVLEKK